METKIIEDQSPEEAGNVKKGKPKATGWDNLFIKKEISVGLNKKVISQDTPEDVSVEQYDIITRNVMETVLFEYFYKRISSIITTKIEVTTKRH